MYIGIKMEAVPDPSNSSLSVAVTWFSANVPVGFRCTEVMRSSTSKNQTTWTVTYMSGKSFSHDGIRAILQKYFCKRLILTTVSHCETLTCNKWLVSFKPWKHTKSYALWNYIAPCLIKPRTFPLEEEPQVVKDVKKTKSVKLNILKHTPKDCHVLSKDGKIESITDSVTVKKLIFNGKNITRKIFGQSRMNNYYLRILKENITKPLIWSKKKKEQIKYHIATPTTPEPKNKSSIDTRPKCINPVSIPYDYKVSENKYLLSKLRDSKCFDIIQKFVALKLYRHDGPPILSAKNITRIGLINDVLSFGFPVDESIIDIFQTYCIEAGISIDDVKDESLRTQLQYYGKLF